MPADPKDTAELGGLMADALTKAVAGGPQDTPLIPGNAPDDEIGIGLGYCLACLTEYKGAPANKRPPWPRPAITMAPALIQALGVVVAVPTCWIHLQAPAEQPAGASLITARGTLPRR